MNNKLRLTLLMSLISFAIIASEKKETATPNTTTNNTAASTQQVPDKKIKEDAEKAVKASEEALTNAQKAANEAKEKLEKDPKNEALVKAKQTADQKVKDAQADLDAKKAALNAFVAAGESSWAFEKNKRFYVFLATGGTLIGLGLWFLYKKYCGNKQESNNNFEEEIL